MRRSTLFAALILGVSASVFAQPPLPQPGPEHEVLRKDVGTWDVTMELTPGAGMPPFSMTGVETDTLLGGRWLIAQYTFDMMGQTFEGHGITGYDPAKKAYVSTWVDTMSTSLMTSEGSFDAATNTMTGTSEVPDPAGGRTKAKSVATWPGPDERVVKIYMTDASQPTVTLTYKRRK
jgi:Protein of unknown function (DUF1579)